MAHTLLLRVSSDAEGQTPDLNVAASPDLEGDAGIAGGTALRRFARAVVQRGEPELTDARRGLVEELGSEALVEAAGVVAQFEAINRVADGTGILLDEMIEQVAPTVLEGVDLTHLRTD